MSSFAAQQVSRLETLLAQNVGVSQVEIDGTRVSYADLLKQYDYWKSRLARLNGLRPRVAQIYLGNYR